MKSFINLAISILLLASCRKQENIVVSEKLLGSWDSYRAELPDGTIEGPAPWMLCCYEQGFEIFADGTYAPRYKFTVDPNEPMTTSNDARLKGTWTLNKDTLSFSHTTDPGISIFRFIITRFDNDEMVIKNPFFNYPVYYLKKR